jgi:hypothetical protein
MTLGYLIMRECLMRRISPHNGFASGSAQQDYNGYKRK